MKAPYQNKKILVVEIIEDEASMLKILSEKFRENGEYVIVAKDGKEGLRLALKEHPDIIVLDLVMPRMDGFEMLKKLREDEWGKTVKVIVLTNLSEDHPDAKVIKNITSEYLLKANISLEELVKKVEGMIIPKK